MFGPAEIPVGEKGCFANATRSRPSEVVYLWACAPDVLRKIASAKPMSLRIPVILLHKVQPSLPVYVLLRQLSDCCAGELENKR